LKLVARQGTVRWMRRATFFYEVQSGAYAMRYFLFVFLLFNSPNFLCAQLFQHTVPAPKELPAEVSKKLDKYFNRFCDYTGGMGIGFVSTHTYDLAFRQQLKKSQDPELKRFFVLKNLFVEIQFDIDEYQKGVKRVGKTEYQPLTPEEKTQARQQILETLHDLDAFGDKETTRWTKELLENLDKPKTENGTFK
jgi:hypothetical protein